MNTKPTLISTRSCSNSNIDAIAALVTITNNHDDDVAPVPEIHLSAEIPAEINSYGAALGLGSSSPYPVNNRDITVIGNRPSDQICVNSDSIFNLKEENEHNAVKVDDATAIEDDVNSELSGGEDARSDISDDPVAWDVDSFDDYPYDLAFKRLAALGNLTRRNSADLMIDSADFESYLVEGGVWVPNAVLHHFQDGGFSVNHRVFRTLFRNPRVALETIIKRPAPLSQQRHRQIPRLIIPLPLVKSNPNDEDESWLDTPNTAPYGQYVEGVPSSHPTGQVPRENETFEEDLENPGQWLVRFRRPLSDGTAYERVDPLRIFNPAAVVTIPPDEIETELGGDPTKIPTFSKYDKGFWIKLANQPEVGGAYRRHYDVPPKSKNKAVQDSKATVLFVYRRFSRTTGQYTMQYKWGETWDAWDRNLSTFAINDTEMCRTFNRWLKQVMEKYDYRYEKRGTRECWKDYELTLLREHFNELIKKKGLIEAHSKADWKQVLDRINKARRARDLNAALRNENGVSSQAERDGYGPNNPRMGIQEWRQLGSQLKTLEKKYPGLKISDEILKPRDCIPMNDIKEKRAGGDNEVSRQWKAEGVKRKEVVGKTQTKIVVSYSNGQFRIADRFNGALVYKFFGGPAPGAENEVTAHEQNKEEQEPSKVLDQQGPTGEDEQGRVDSESEDEFEEPAAKRQKR
jgi:hypothetical protein